MLGEENGLGQVAGVSRCRRGGQLHPCRRISAREESLSVPLFHRHARGLILTEQGELLFRTAREVFAKLSMAEGLISESKDRPKGPLKITSTVAFGSTWLTPRIREFLDLYPEIQVTLVVDDTELDLSMREADRKSVV